MPAVSDTSPILGLAAIDCLHLLRRQFEHLDIPAAVFSELKTFTNFRGAGDINQALKEGWISQIKVQDSSLMQALSLDLDRGEAEAIALALQLGCSRILMDESDGRARAKALGLKSVGVLGVLLRAKQEGQIASVRQAMLALRQEVGFYIVDELFISILEQAGEK
jgi:predicted nucleic acid-binding protein